MQYWFRLGEKLHMTVPQLQKQLSSEWFGKYIAYYNLFPHTQSEKLTDTQNALLCQVIAVSHGHDVELDDFRTIKVPKKTMTGMDIYNTLLPLVGETT